MVVLKDFNVLTKVCQVGKAVGGELVKWEGGWDGGWETQLCWMDHLCGENSSSHPDFSLNFTLFTLVDGPQALPILLFCFEFYALISASG